MGILNFGSCNIDMVYSVSHITKPGETVPAQGFAIYPGGKGLNQSVALARAGATVFHAGCIGSDGEFLRELLANAGADTRYLKTVTDKTGHAVIQVDSSGENCIIIYQGANAQVTKEHIDAVLSDFQAGDYLLTQNEISELPYLIAQAAAKGLQVILNPSPMQESLKQLNLSQIRYLVLNETEADELLGTQDSARIQQLLQENYPNLTVVLTLGRNGSVYISPKKVFRQSAFSVPNVDTTAAGDTFTGYLIAAISAGQAAEEAMRMASAASALAVSQNGAASSIPSRQTVETALNTLQPYQDRSEDLLKNKVHQFLNHHYSDGTVQMLAQELGYSPSYTVSWIKSHMGTTFTKLLIQKKCQISAHCLEHTDMSVGDIISHVGYRNESHFRKLFFAQYQCTPLKYRKRKDIAHEPSDT